MLQNPHGILNLNKPSGISSHDAVYAVREILQTQRVGHAGTLDPMASGVLLMCVGNATRVTEYLQDHDKTYRARVRLGIETDTYDATGAIVFEKPFSTSPQQIEKAAHSFIGKLKQTPPIYSAIKQQGTPLYKLARRGAEVQVDARAVEIYAIEELKVDLPAIEFTIRCSKGTYIRSLAHDLGEKLGCGAHLAALTRLASGEFKIEDALTLDQLRDAATRGEIAQHLHSLDRALTHFDSATLEPDEARQIQNGIAIKLPGDFTSPLLCAYDRVGVCIALLEPTDQDNMWKPKKVFAV
ncbi:MAG: tRNA pseudouridine(55) synthase TruB [Chloroflexi bacterium]|nr:tRNA pseudouridine(55) synthase TruB [Chloroflexota bacterium]